MPFFCLKAGYFQLILSPVKKFGIFTCFLLSSMV